MGTNYVIKYQILVKSQVFQFSCQIAIRHPVKQSHLSVGGPYHMGPKGAQWAQMESLNIEFMR